MNKMQVNVTSDVEDIVEYVSINETFNCNIEFNFSSIGFPSDDALIEPLIWEDYIKIIFYVIVLLIALIGNVSVILTVLLNRSMRTTINLYLVNLAAADLFICVCCMWIPVANSVTKPLYSLGAFFCKLNPFAQMTCLTSSVLTLSAISCDRFIAIIFPLHVRITKQRTSVVISAIWLVSMAVAAPFLFIQTYKIIQWQDMTEAVCHDEWPMVEYFDHALQACIRKFPLKQLYYTFVCITLFFLPVAIMATAYLLIIWRLWRTQAPGERNLANINVQHRAKKKVIKMVCVVLCGFVVCWSPFQIAVLYSQFGHSVSEVGQLPMWFDGFFYFSTFLAYSNSAINPILYGGFNNNFRQGFCNICRCPNSAPLRRPQFSQKSRTTLMSGLTGSPSSGRVNGVGPSSRMFEMRTIHDSRDLKRENTCSILLDK